MRYFAKKRLKSAALATALLSTTGIANANWTGSWDSNYGELRLVQEGSRVYGDYAGRGYFEGCALNDGKTLRGTFQYNSNRGRNGFIEFQMGGNGFTGGWNYLKDGPASASQNNWRGTRKLASKPALKYAVGKHNYWADFWQDTSGANRMWAAFGCGGNAYSPKEAQPGPPTPFAVYGEHGDIRGDEWHGTFDTNYGELRLVQVGRRVYGEYAKRGYFEGCVFEGGKVLRATYQYFKPRRKHGFVEFRLDGDGFKGSWTWTKNGVPKPGSKINWSGARSALDVPAEVYIRGNEMGFADMWADLSAQTRKWVLGSDYYDSCDPPETDYNGADNPGDDKEFPGEML